jgi:hypothetical protein
MGEAQGFSEEHKRNMGNGVCFVGPKGNVGLSLQSQNIRYYQRLGFSRLQRAMVLYSEGRVNQLVPKTRRRFKHPQEAVPQHLIYMVASQQTNDTVYSVRWGGKAEMSDCSCPDHQQANQVCKHILAVRLFRSDQYLYAAHDERHFYDDELIRRASSSDPSIISLVAHNAYHPTLATDNDLNHDRTFVDDDVEVAFRLELHMALHRTQLSNQKPTVLTKKPRYVAPPTVEEDQEQLEYYNATKTEPVPKSQRAEVL